MRIQTEHLDLSEISTDDISEHYVGWLNDTDVNRYLETRFSDQNKETVTSFVSGVIASSSEMLLAIKEKDGRHIGNIKLGMINKNHGSAEVSYFIGDKKAWGKGYATEAVFAVSGYAFNELKLRYLKAGVYSSNKASIAVLEKCGYRFQGRLKSALLIEGSEDDHLFYCLHRDWR